MVLMEKAKVFLFFFYVYGCSVYMCMHTIVYGVQRPEEGGELSFFENTELLLECFCPPRSGTRRVYFRSLPHLATVIYPYASAKPCCRHKRLVPVTLNSQSVN